MIQENQEPRTSNSNFGYLTFVIVPVMLFGYVGTPISTIWLLILGEWKIVVFGVLIGIVVAFALPFLLIPAAILFVRMHQSNTATQARNNFATLFGWIYMIIVSIAIPLSILLVCLKQASDTNLVLALTLSYGVAVFPFMRLTKLASASGQAATDEMFNTFFIQLAYIISIVGLYYRMTFTQVALMFTLIYSSLALLYLIINWNAKRSEESS